MKKLMILICFLLSQVGISQEEKQKDSLTNKWVMTGSFDPQNLFWGSDRNDPALDWISRMHLEFPLNDRWAIEAVALVEIFQEINYTQWALGTNIQYKPFSKFPLTVSGGIELGLIDRDEVDDHISIGFNIEPRIHFGRFSVGLLGNLESTPDIKDGKYFRYSNYITMNYTIKLF